MNNTEKLADNSFMLINHRKRRVLIVVFMLLVVGGLVTLCFKKFSQNITFFVLPHQIYQAPEKYRNIKIRVGGMVLGEIAYKSESQIFEFKLQEEKDGAIYLVEVRYKGILPSLLQPGQMSIIKGVLRLDSIETCSKGVGLLIDADEVLAKHDENYRVPS